MKFRKSVFLGLALIGMAGMAAPSIAKADVDIFFSIAPPPLPFEVVPRARPGYVWAPGYWDVRSHRHVWRAGHWERARPGYYYAAPRWVRHGHRWQLHRAHWVRDFDRRDGRYDRDRRDDRRWGDRGRGYGDRDRDGVPNRYDNAPRNPRHR